MNLQNAFQMARKAQESLYDSKCVIFRLKNFEKPNGAAGQKKEILVDNQPCRVSKKNVSASNQTDAENSIEQIPQLFISPEVEVPPGSRVVVTQIVADRTIITEYDQTGVPSVYKTHQEILMRLANRQA